MSAPSFFWSKKVFTPSSKLSQKHHSNHIKRVLGLCAVKVVVNWTKSKHMAHSASSVRQEIINNKKSVNVISAFKISAPSFFRRKKRWPCHFFHQKSLCPFNIFAKKCLSPCRPSQHTFQYFLPPPLRPSMLISLIMRTGI